MTRLDLDPRRQPRALRDPAAGTRPPGSSSHPSGSPREGPEPHLAALLSPHSFEADQYRVLRHFLEQARAAAAFKVVAVTSPGAGDGKTTTAINLAATLAQGQGARVLLVDTDLRRPLVGSNLGLAANAPGLVSAVLDERLDLAAVVRSTPYNLSVLPAGPPPANAYQILDSPRVGQLLDEARKTYDYVVLDMPPVLLVPDCRLMAQSADRFLLVISANKTTRRLLGEALSAMDEAKMLGIVFNRDERPLYGSYKRQYGSYYYRDRSSAGRRGFWSRLFGRGGSRPQRWR